jgi:putative inorganic carbon (HCO3(-)) transporter
VNSFVAVLGLGERPFGARRAPSFGEHARRYLPWVAGAVGAALVTLLVQRYDAPLVFAGLCALSGALVLLVRPEWATLVVVFLLYVNFPALASRRGVPVALASSFLLLLALPLLYHVVLRRERLRSDTPFRLMVAFLVVLVISSVGAKNPEMAAEYRKSFITEGLLLYWLVVNVIRSLPTLRRVIWTILFAGALLGALTAYQEVTKSYHQQFGGLVQRYSEYLELRARAEDPDIRERLESYSGVRSARPGGPVSQANRFAQILVVLVPLGVFMHRTSRSARARFCALMLGGLILCGMILTLSRGNFVTLVAVTIMMMFLKWVRPSRVLLCALLLSAAVPVVAPAFFTRIKSIATSGSLLSDDPTKHRQADGAIRGRTTEMLAALHVFLDHPVLGVGPAQFQLYVQEYGSAPGISFRDIHGQRRAHNLYLEMAAENGVVGLAVFLAVIGWLMRRLWAARRHWTGRNSELANLATAYWLSLLAYLGSGVFAHLSFQRYYWFLLAMAGAAVHLLYSRDQARQTGTRGRVPEAAR